MAAAGRPSGTAGPDCSPCLPFLEGRRLCSEPQRATAPLRGEAQGAAAIISKLAATTFAGTRVYGFATVGSNRELAGGVGEQSEGFRGPDARQATTAQTAMPLPHRRKAVDGRSRHCRASAGR